MSAPLLVIPPHVDIEASFALCRRLLAVVDRAETGYSEAWWALRYAAEITGTRGYNFTSAALNGWDPKDERVEVPELSINGLARFIASESSGNKGGAS